MSECKKQTVAECICDQYNSLKNCIDFKSEESYSDYLTTVHDLNSMLLTGIINDDKANHEFYFYVGLANYIIHNYHIARVFFEKSIKLENNSTNIDYIIGFRKRLFLCYCYEYGNLSLNSVCLKNLGISNSLEYAIYLLVGKNINFFMPLNSKIVEEIDKISEIDSCSEILKAIVVDDKADSLFNYIKCHSELYSTEYIKEISHILAHCLSELSKRNDMKPKKALYSIRIAERLMYFLGEDYITCYATLLAENNDFVSAFKEMTRVRNNYQLELTKLSNSLEKNEEQIAHYTREIAQINYYGWYFSFLSNFERQDTWKEAFKIYCDSSSDDYAKVYYELLNMKEIYQEIFAEMKRNLNDRNYTAMEEMHAKITSAFNSFKNIRLCPNIFQEIQDEWNRLKALFNVYLCCYAITSNENEYHLLKYMSALTSYTDNQVQIQQDFRLEGEKSKNCYYLLSFESNTDLLYFGSLENLIEYVKSLRIVSKILIRDYTFDSLKERIKASNISNCLLLINSNNFETAKEILDVIDSHNDIVYPETANLKNVFIHTSGLTKEQEEKLHYKEDENFFHLNNSIKCTLLSFLFTILEGGIYGVFKEFSPFVIAPVDDTTTIEWQNTTELKKFKADEIGITLCDIPLQNCLTPCFSDDTDSKSKRKELFLPKGLEKNIYKVIAFEEIEKSDVRRVYSFDVENQMFYADPVTFPEQRSKETDVFSDIKRLFKRFKTNDGKKHDGCSKGACYSRFECEDLETDNFKNLKRYLFALLGISWTDKKYMMLRLPETLDSPNRMWLLFIFNNSPDLLVTESICCFCRSVGDIIKDAVDLKFKSTATIPLEELRNNLKKVDRNKKYVFISYRCANDNYELCYPVYTDCMNHWGLNLDGEPLNYAIDRGSFDVDFDNEITTLLTNDNCIGAFIYLSKDYFVNCDADDRCLKEIQLINERCEKGNFFKICLFIEGTHPKILLPDMDRSNSIISYIEKTLHRYNGAYRGDHEDEPSLLPFYKKDTARLSEYGKFFGTNGTVEDTDVHIIVEKWTENMDLLSCSNFANALSKVGITKK